MPGAFKYVDEFQRPCRLATVQEGASCKCTWSVASPFAGKYFRRNIQYFFSILRHCSFCTVYKALLGTP